MATTSGLNSRATEYWSIPHVFADADMTRAITELVKTWTRTELRAELDSMAVDSSTHHIAVLINNKSFTPATITISCDGVKKIQRILFKANFVTIRTWWQGFQTLVYVARVTLWYVFIPLWSVEVGWVWEFHVFCPGKRVHYVRICFCRLHTILWPLTTRASQSDAQRKKGVCDVVITLSNSASKRKREKEEVRVARMEFSPSALCQCYDDVVRKTENADRNRACL